LAEKAHEFPEMTKISLFYFRMSPFLCFALIQFAHDSYGFDHQMPPTALAFPFFFLTTRSNVIKQTKRKTNTT